MYWKELNLAEYSNCIITTELPGKTENCIAQGNAFAKY